jgi:hypothetical protein
MQNTSKDKKKIQFKLNENNDMNVMDVGVNL